MNSVALRSVPRGFAGLAAIAALALGSFALRPSFAGDPAPAVAAEAKTFASPEDAAAALVAALEKNDDAALDAIFGPGSADVRESSTDVVVAKRRRELTVLAKTLTSIDRTDPERLVVQFGYDAWPFPVPLVKKADRWAFDLAAGRDEILARQIGRNELTAISICRTYVDMQVAYAEKDRDGDKVREYAQRILSTPGSHDGLHWEGSTTDDPSPLAARLTSMKDLLEGRVAGAPFAGYTWRVLDAQGANAPGGAHSYVINGNMIAGFALVGTPAEYRKTGVKTFLVSHHGDVYEKDLGEKSLDLAKAITTFDPDSSWAVVPQD